MLILDRDGQCDMSTSLHDDCQTDPAGPIVIMIYPCCHITGDHVLIHCQRPLLYADMLVSMPWLLLHAVPDNTCLKAHLQRVSFHVILCGAGAAVVM